MKLPKKGIVFGIVAACLLCVGGLLFLVQPKALTVTAQATLYVPTDDAYFKQEYGGYRSYPIAPNQNGSIAEGAHDAPYRKTAFHQGVLRSGFDHGPTSIRGSFPLSGLKAYWEGIPLAGDWPFQIDLYNTSSGRKFQISPSPPEKVQEFQGSRAFLFALYPLYLF